MAPSKTTVFKPKSYKARLAASKTKIKMCEGIVLPDDNKKCKFFLSFMHWYKKSYHPQLDRDNIANLIPQDETEAKFFHLLMFCDENLPRSLRRSTQEEFLNKELSKIAEVVDQYDAEHFINKRCTKTD